MNADTRERDVNNSARDTMRPRAFLGVRHPVAKRVLAVAMLAAIALGAYAVYDRYVLAPRRHEAIHSGQATKRLYARWQRKGPKGWKRLLEEAARGYPGYSVDMGLPARLKLVELGDRIVPLANETLENPNQAMRMTAIYLLGAVGQPHDRIAELLLGEVKRARNHNEAVEAMKCANALGNNGPVLERVSLAALESPYRKAREVAAGYLVYLAGNPNADPQLRRRLDELMTSADPKVRVELAVQMLAVTPVESYSLLLDMLASDHDEVRTITVNHIARLRDADPIRDTTPSEAIPGIIERHRHYLRVAIAVARIDEDWAAAFRALDEGLHNDNEDLVLGVANLVTALRGQQRISANVSEEQKTLRINDQRRYVGIGVAAAGVAEHPDAAGDPIAAYTTLLEGLDDSDPKMALDVAVIVARMRGLPPSFDAGAEQEALAEQRTWVQHQLDEATSGANESTEPADETAPADADDAATIDNGATPDDAPDVGPGASGSDATAGSATAPEEQ